MTVQGGWDAGELARCFAFGRRCAAGARHQRSGAGLSQPAGAGDHRLLAGGRDRRARPPDRRQAQHALGPAGDRREPPRRRRQYRRRLCVAGRARRLHAAFRRADARHQRDARADHRVPSGHELRADHAGRHRAGDLHGGERHAVPFGERGGRLRQGQSRQAELRIGRHRHQRASGDRAVQRGDRREDAARALQPDVADLSPTCSPGAPRSGSPPRAARCRMSRSGKVRGLAVNGPVALASSCPSCRP